MKNNDQSLYAQPSFIRTSGQLGPLLRALRKARGWSQSDLGAQLGLSQERVSAIERYPERMTVQQLLTVLMTLDAQLEVTRRPVGIAEPGLW